MLAPNTLLQDRYLVLRLLGQGGMGAVYQATDRKFGNAVALKETFYADEQLRKAFAQEARLLNRLRHAALPVVMDYFAVSDKQFLVMQYIPGKDLEQMLEERKERGDGLFMTSQVLLWADQLLDALEYLHAQNPPIIHRDIKPQNLKLTPRGEIILLDFGLAKGIVTHQSRSSQSIRGYTPNYASLEQIRGTGTDARSDIYSIGATLYHLLTGKLPQDALTRVAALLMNQPDPLRPINELNPEVPALIAAVIEKAMSANPEQRQESASVLRQSLRNASRNIPPVSSHRAPTLTNHPLADCEAIVEELELNITTEIIPVPPRMAEQISAEPIAQTRNLAQPLPGKPITPSQTRRRPKHVRLATRNLPPSRKRAVWYGAIATVLLIASLGMHVQRVFKDKTGLMAGAAELVTATQANAANAANGGKTIPMRVEVMRYYLEVADGGNGDVAKRATGLAPLPAGSRFKFHFRPRTGGYFYLLALGKNGVPQTFLTERPMPASGVKTNWTDAGQDFLFPDVEQWFMMQRESETTPFTVIFSPTPLKSPNFLATAAGRDLTPTEQQELLALRKRYAATNTDLVAMMDDNQPAVTVQIPAERRTDEPLIFDIAIKRK